MAPKRSIAYQIVGNDGSPENKTLEVFPCEGILIEDLEQTQIDLVALTETLAYFEANAPQFAISDSAVKIPGWRPRLSGEALSLPEATVGISATSPTGLVLTDSVDELPEIATVFPNALSNSPPKSPAGILALVGAYVQRPETSRGRSREPGQLYKTRLPLSAHRAN